MPCYRGQQLRNNILVKLLLISVAGHYFLRYIKLSAVSLELSGLPKVLRTRVAAPSVCFAVARILLAAAPTAPPCFRHWRRSSPLPLVGEVASRSDDGEV